ncbi:MAG: PDZ domain-containing protein, partial [Mangrovimonas sp.]|nr:PDZ domain-containing protein [Mangrovimonas sp.]
FELKNPNVAIPDSVSVIATRLVNDRNGSMSGEILKRFNIVFDYPHQQMTFKKNKYFDKAFSYNKSGLELEHNGIRLLQEEVFEASPGTMNENSQTSSGIKISFDKKLKFSVKPAFAIVELRNDSPAQRAGLKIGDIIIKINGRETHKMELQDVMAIFYGDDGETIRMDVDRKGQLMHFSFVLESML